MHPDDIPDENLLYLVGTTDKELFDAGEDIKQRYWKVPQAVMKKLGYVNYVMTGRSKPKILQRIEDTFMSIVGTTWNAFDVARVKRVIEKQPAYVPNRYSAEQPDRREVGHLVMGAQYIVSEVVRQMSGRDFRKCIQPSMTRRYPA